MTIYSAPSVPYNIRPVTIIQTFANCATAKAWSPVIATRTDLQSQSLAVVTSVSGCSSINGVDYYYDSVTSVANISVRHTWSRPLDSARVEITYTKATDTWKIEVYKGTDSVAYADSTNEVINAVEGQVKPVWGGSVSIPSSGLVSGCDTGNATIVFG